MKKVLFVIFISFIFVGCSMKSSFERKSEKFDELFGTTPPSEIARFSSVVLNHTKMKSIRKEKTYGLSGFWKFGKSSYNDNELTINIVFSTIKSISKEKVSRLLKSNSYKACFKDPSLRVMLNKGVTLKLNVKYNENENMEMKIDKNSCDDKNKKVNYIK